MRCNMGEWTVKVYIAGYQYIDLQADSEDAAYEAALLYKEDFLDDTRDFLTIDAYENVNGHEELD